MSDFFVRIADPELTHNITRLAQWLPCGTMALSSLIFSHFRQNSLEEALENKCDQSILKQTCNLYGLDMVRNSIL